MTLTIAIPTYNRADKLETALRKLSENQLEDVAIIVVDNASTDHTQEIVAHYLDGRLNGKLRYIRNPANIGAEANFMRCFEQTTTEWLWLLGDDDEPTPNALSHICATIKANPEAIYCNFATSILDIRASRASSFVTLGLRDFLTGLDCYSNLAFISAGVFRAGRLNRHLTEGYRYAHTMISYLALVLRELHDSPTATCVFSRRRIASCKLGPPSWSYDRYCNHAFLLIEALPSPELRMLLLEKMNFVDPFTPSYNLRLLHQSLSTHGHCIPEIFDRYAQISSLTDRYNKHLAISYLCTYVLPRSPLRQVLNGLVKASRWKIPVLARQINKLLDHELGVQRPRQVRLS